MTYFNGNSMTSHLVLSLFISIVCVNANYKSHHVSHSGIRSADVVSPHDFADVLFEKYGNNGTMDVNQLIVMFSNLGIGKDEDKPAKGSVNEKCFSTKSILDVFSINKTLNSHSFNQICPAIVQQIDSQICDPKKELKLTLKESQAKAWGYGFLSVFIISCTSLLGAFVVPFMSQEFYKKLLLFMVSLAVGVLGGSGIFHLIPSALGFSGEDADLSFLYKGCVIVGGIYLFFCIEYFMKMYVRIKDKRFGNTSGHGHSHYLSNDKKFHEEIPNNGIAAAQLEMYNVKQDHPLSHSGSLCIANNFFTNKPALSNSEPSIDFKDPKEAKVTKEETEAEKKHIAPVAWMIIIGDGMHNFIDGLAIGVSFSTSILDGISTALAIFCEELPHELGDFAVLLNAGMSYKKAMLFNFLSACLCFLGLVAGLLLGYNTSAVKWIKALAGGMFLYISLVDMFQEATEMSCKEGEGSMRKNLKTFALQAFGMLLGFVVMFLLALYSSTIKI